MFFSEYGFRCLPLIRHIGLNWEKLFIQGIAWLRFIKLLKKTRAILTLSWHPLPHPHYHPSWTPHCPSQPASIPPLTSPVQVPPAFFSSSKNGKVKNFSFDLNYRFTTKTDTGSRHSWFCSLLSHADWCDKQDRTAPFPQAPIFNLWQPQVCPPLLWFHSFKNIL